MRERPSMRRKRALCIATLAWSVVAAGAAWAEGGCPPGMIPYSAASPNACAPIPSGPAPRGAARPRWASQWGALAFDAAAGIMGAASDTGSKREARRVALENCRARGGRACKVEMSYRDSCVVVVAGDRQSDTTTASSAERAAEIGLGACEARKDRRCELYYAECSFPVRER
ncbi:DUF4189 domain-containing protein [Lysobacter sp. CA196]|uniref:DUF4189 domain-containing protein n=1 Tax=Lysobacter sp. CA196 TaxID=3455606 RepID=UPI003F8D028B